MSGALSKFAAGGNLQLNDAQAANALRRSADEGQTGGGTGVDFLSFSGKRGTYSLGRDKDDVDPDQVFILEPLAAVEGWTCWKNGKPAKKHQWSIYDTSKAVAYADLEDLGPYNENVGEGWQQMMGIGLVDADDPQRSILFTITNVSGRNVFSDLQNEVADQMENGDPYIPLVAFDMEEFEAHGQKNFKPVINVQAWVTREEVAAYFEGDFDIDDLMDGKCVPAGEAEAEPEEAAEDEAPKTRTRARRRKAA